MTRSDLIAIAEDVLATYSTGDQLGHAWEDNAVRVILALLGALKEPGE